MRAMLVLAVLLGATSSYAQTEKQIEDEIIASNYVQAMDKLSVKILVPLKKHIDKSEGSTVPEQAIIAKDVLDMYKNADYAIDYYKLKGEDLEASFFNKKTDCQIEVASPVDITEEIATGIYVQSMDKLSTKIYVALTSTKTSANTKTNQGVVGAQSLNAMQLQDVYKDVTDMYKNADYALDYHKLKIEKLQTAISTLEADCKKKVSDKKRDAKKVVPVKVEKITKTPEINKN